MNGLNLKNIVAHLRLRFSGYFTLLILLTIALGLLRVYFFFKYSDAYTGIEAASVLKAFVQGARFDLSTVSIMSAPFFLALFFPGIALSRFLRRGILAALLAWYIVLLVYNFIDIQYYTYAQRHLTFELGNTWKDTDVIVKIGLSRYVPEFIGLIVFLVAFSAAFVWSLKGRRRSPLTCRGSYIACVGIDAVVFILVVVLTVVFARGGVQMKPMSIKNAFANDRIELGALALNGIYSTFNTLYNTNDDKNIEVLNAIKFENKADVAGFIVDRTKETSRPEYPLFRKYNYPENGGRKLNVVIFLMESWSAKFMGSLGGKVEAAPFFSSLSKEGMLLNNCFANAQRSYEGLTATLGSMPSWKGMSLDQGGLLYQTRLEPAVSALKRNGYDTIFIHGARPGSLGFDSLAKRFGFQRHLSREDFGNLDGIDDGVWGIYDEYAFLRANEEFDKMEKPFFGVVYSLTSHTPYKVPSKEFEHFGPDVDHRDFLNSMRYSDYALGKFFEKARKSKYFKDTLFVIVADHTEGVSTGDNIFNNYHIPCLFYGAGVAPSVYEGVASQLDILPTVLDILNVDAPFTSWGKSILSNGERRALLPRGDMFVWVNGKYMLLTDLQNPLGLYDYKSDPAQNKLKEVSEKEYKPLKEEFQQYMKFSYDLILSNSVRPPQ